MLELLMEIHHFTLDKTSSPMNRKGQLGRCIPAFEGLEPYAGKLASTVLRRERAAKP